MRIRNPAQNCYLSHGLDRRSGIRDQGKNLFRIPDRKRRSKKHRILDMDPQLCETVLIRIDMKVRVPVSKLRAEFFKAQELLMCFQGPTHFRDNNYSIGSLYTTVRLPLQPTTPH
jgi:hypothetical protein